MDSHRVGYIYFELMLEGELASEISKTIRW